MAENERTAIGPGRSGVGSLVRTTTSFDAMRLLAALGVLVSHHYLVSGRPQPTVGSYGTFGPFCVFVFFAISGYFIAASWARDPNLIRFWAKRVLRIFPALIATVVLTVFVLGPLTTELRLSAYFSDSETWAYLKNAILVFGIQYDLPGVFTQNHTSDVNLSLWSLPIEVMVYAVLAVAAFAVPSRARISYPTLAVIGGLLWLAWPSPDGYAITQAFGLGATFFVAASIHAYGLLPRITNAVVIAAGLVLVLGALLSTEVGRPLLWVALPVVALGLGARTTHLGSAVARAGDISYGVYVWAFPIQQLLVGTFGFVTSLVLAIGLTTVAGVVSMKLIEVPALTRRPSGSEPSLSV